MQEMENLVSEKLFMNLKLRLSIVYDAFEG